jgi:hypothetical protein
MERETTGLLNQWGFLELLIFGRESKNTNIESLKSVVLHVSKGSNKIEYSATFPHESLAKIDYGQTLLNCHLSYFVSQAEVGKNPGDEM